MRHNFCNFEKSLLEGHEITVLCNYHLGRLPCPLVRPKRMLLLLGKAKPKIVSRADDIAMAMRHSNDANESFLDIASYCVYMI